MKGDELDRIMDDALASYSLQEPRMGLAGRVMVRVRADGVRRRSGWFQFAVVGSALSCVAIAMVLWRDEPRPQPVATVPAAAEKKAEQPRDLPHPDTARRAKRARPPRLESFPGPSPLTAEERVLIAFTQQAPEAALRLAQTDKPLEIEAIDIRPIQIDGLQTGEIK